MNSARFPTTATGKVAVLFLLGLSFTCAALAGCGSASTSTAGARPPSATNTATATATAMQRPTCQTSQLTLTLDRSGVALGHVSVLLRLANRSQQTCVLDGYPRLQLLDAHQQPLPTHEQQTTSAYTFTVPAPQPVVLAPGAGAYVHLEWRDVPLSDQPCFSGVAFLQVTPPHNQTPLLLALDAGGCDGTLITSPFEPTVAST